MTLRLLSRSPARIGVGASGRLHNHANPDLPVGSGEEYGEDGGSGRGQCLEPAPGLGPPRLSVPCSRTAGDVTRSFRHLRHAIWPYILESWTVTPWTNMLFFALDWAECLLEPLAGSALAATLFPLDFIFCSWPRRLPLASGATA